jgi:hypothetical protein
MVAEIRRPGPARAATTRFPREDQSLLSGLEHGQLFWFSDWPVAAVPRSGAMVYTVWNRVGHFIYVGMAGRGETSTARGFGPFGRLNSHASGRRSGDQFSVYVCDRLVLPTARDRIDDIVAGSFSLDQATRDYVRNELGFRMVQVADGREALQVERLVQRSPLAAERPLLNPLGSHAKVNRLCGLEPSVLPDGRSPAPRCASSGPSR